MEHSCAILIDTISALPMYENTMALCAILWSFSEIYTFSIFLLL